MATYGLTIDKETHAKYIKLTHLYKVSPYWFADQMRDKFTNLINELWEKRKEKNKDTNPIIVKDVNDMQKNTQTESPDEDLNFYKDIVLYNNNIDEDDKDE